LFVTLSFIKKPLSGTDALAAGANPAEDVGGASGSAVASRAFAFGDTGAVGEEVFAAGVEALAADPDAVESVAEAGADGEEGVGVRPSLTRAMAAVDDPKNANNMAAMATLTSLPLT
jgi:hypothetical protein